MFLPQEWELGLASVLGSSWVEAAGPFHFYFFKFIFQLQLTFIIILVSGVEHSD